ncbi:MAG: nucleoid-associated protein [Saccharospirillaceae bacterium]|nr:nucleoid-associated protein [Pseudomonadales bacterium]NRB80275.1 nucleoid-associated protein [Saccharospirillaceae bacterium]
MTIESAWLTEFSRNESAGSIKIGHPFEQDQSADSINELFNNFKLSYLKRSSKVYGHFAAQDHVFAQHINAFIGKQKTLAELNDDLTGLLNTFFNDTQDCFDFKLMLVHETLEDQENIYLLFLTHKTVNTFNDDLNIESVDVIDYSKLPFGLKIDLELFSSNDTKYMSMLNTRGSKEMSEAFVNFSGFVEGVDVKKQTEEFLQIVDRFSQEIPKDEVSDYRTKVVDYCLEQDSRGEEISIKEINTQIKDLPFEPSEDFSAFVARQQETPQETIIPHRASLKRYVRFFGRDKKMSISFDSDRFGQDIQYDEVNQTLTINELPQSLQKQIKQYLDKA